MSCLPTCSSVDGRFIVISEGATLSTFTPNSLYVRLRVPAGSTSFSIGVFDWDNGFKEPGTFGFWDITETPFLYILKIDPDGDNSGTLFLKLYQKIFLLIIGLILHFRWMISLWMKTATTYLF